MMSMLLANHTSRGGNDCSRCWMAAPDQSRQMVHLSWTRQLVEMRFFVRSSTYRTCPVVVDVVVTLALLLLHMHHSFLLGQFPVLGVLVPWLGWVAVASQHNRAHNLLESMREV